MDQEDAQTDSMVGSLPSEYYNGRGVQDLGMGNVAWTCKVTIARYC